jgi:hypothetical protein
MSGTTLYSSLLLDQSNWDLCVDAKSNIAVARPPYSTAQDVACAIRTFFGEVYYDKTLGVPYFGKILGQDPSLSYLRAQIEAAALSVSGVVTATCSIESVTARKVTGSVVFTDSSGQQQTVSLG